MNEFFGCWTGEGPGEAIECFIPDGSMVLLHTLYRGSLEEPRREVLFPLEPNETVQHGELSITCRLGEGALGITVTHNDTVVLQRVCTQVDGALHIEESTFEGSNSLVLQRQRVKQVIVYRRDLKMRKGKIAAQCAHAALKVFLDRNQATGPRIQAMLPGPMAVWMRGGSAKIVLSVEDEGALDQVAHLAKLHGIPVARITDSGRTEFKGVPTKTTVALGPWTVDAIDAITGPGGLVPTKLA